MKTIFEYRQSILSMIILALLCSTPVLAQQDQRDAKRQQRAERAKQLEAKLADVRSQFTTLGSKLKQASNQADSNLEAEMNAARNELRDGYTQLKSTYAEEVGALETSLADVWNQVEGKRDEARTKLDAKLGQLREEWNAGYAQLQAAQKQQVQQLRTELDDLEKQLKTSTEKLTSESLQRRADLRKEYEANAMQMRNSYHAYISTLDTEAKRIQSAAKLAGGELAETMMVAHDDVQSKMNGAYDDLHAGYQEVTAKANSYVEQTFTRMKNTETSAKANVQMEMDEVSRSAAEIQAQMAASYEKYHEALEDQIDLLNQRAETSEANAKAKLQETAAELENKRKTTEESMVDAYQSCAKTIQADIDRLKSSMDQVDAETRAKIVKLIEQRQAELESVKEKLQ